MTDRLVCTVATKAYLADVRVLAASLAEHAPGVPLVLLLADRIDGYFDPESEPFRVVLLEDLVDPDVVAQMTFYYRPFELCCALRGWLHTWILDHASADRWLFLDGDVLVLDSLEPLWDRLDRAPILLSPHLLKPVEESKVRSHELLHLRLGMWNGGFLGLRRGETAASVASWLRSRLARYGCDDPAAGQFVDQRWLDWLPIFFPEAAAVDDPGVNVAYWNLHERALARTEGGWTAGGSPLRFVHWSGWSHLQPHRLTGRNADFQSAAGPIWRELAEQYRGRLLDAGVQETRTWPYAFADFHDGAPILDTMRRDHLRDLEAGVGSAVSPFDRSREFYRRHRAPRRWLRRTGKRVLRAAGLR
ncbi:MAG: glycosyl transferase, group 1 [Acidobacteriota bacterium]